MFHEDVSIRLPLLERRSQLVEAALSVAANEGIGAATIRRVAEEAGVALGVVHYCFEDKDELFGALAARIVEDLRGAGAAAVDLDNPHDLPTAVRAAIGGLWASVEASAGTQLLTYEITTHALRNPDLSGVAARQYDASQAAAEALLNLVAEASGATWSRPVPELAGEALAFIDGVTLRWLVDRDSAAARARLISFGDYLVGQAKPRRRGKAAR
jgi:AcrR family transcriptional regulator